MKFIRKVKSLLSSLITLFYSIQLFIFNSYETLLYSVNSQTISKENGSTDFPQSVTDIILEVEIVAKITNVSTFWNTFDNTFYIFYLFFDLRFSSMKYVINSLGIIQEI